MNVQNGLERRVRGNWRDAWPGRLRSGRMFGTRAWWSVTPDPLELGRRGAHQISPLKSLDVTAVLLALPVGLPVAENSLRPKELRVISSLPSCLVERIDGAVVRRTSPPVTVDQIVLPTRCFRRGLETVTQFSTYCARSVVVTARTTLSDIELAEVSYYGVGVYYADGDSLVEVVAPEPMPPWPETPASWVFAELLWEELNSRR
jgi:hypothetical protein